MEHLLDEYTGSVECVYRGRTYLVRDNGAIFRCRKKGCKSSRYDEEWTFGKRDERTGYLLIGSERVHRIVCTAYHGEPEEPEMVVDHKDTNRCNNRPENLHWVTRLENVLNNPYTRQRIIFLCGSIEAFLKNPSILRESASEPNTKWMRTVTKEEAAKCLKNLSRWLEEDKAHEQSKDKEAKGGIGEWIFSEKKNTPSDELGESWDKEWFKRDYRSEYSKQMDEIEEAKRRLYEEEFGLKDSLTPGAKQLKWKVPSEFPLCPSEHSSAPLQDYLANLREGEVFCRNDVYESFVHKAGISEDGSVLAVIATSAHVNGESGFVLSRITFEDGCYIHENRHSYFEEIGAEKYFTLELGKEWTGGDVFDDFC